MATTKSIFKKIEGFINDGWSYVEYRNSLNGSIKWSGNIFYTPFIIHRNYNYNSHEVDYDSQGCQFLVVYIEGKDWTDKF